MDIIYNLSILLAAVSHIRYVQGQSSCVTPNQVNGQCISIYDCASLLQLVNNRQKTAEDINLLRNSQCGFNNNNAPMVCCPPTYSDDRRCFTPDAKEGTCIGLLSCSHLAQLLQPPIKDNSIVKFIQNSRCEGPEKYSVCCGPDVSMDVAPSRVCNPSVAPPDPRTECCGLDSSGGNKIFGGNATAIDQYPWLALIEYRGAKEDKIRLLCGGALISSRYVLTAGHCVKGPVLNYGTPVNVRLGEYDTSNSGIDCVEVAGGGQDCTEPVQIIPIEQVIPHPDYDPASQLRRNDIALLRLKSMAPYTDFIRPICLPVTDFTTTSTNATLYASGWGAVSDSTSSSNIKLFVDLPFSTMQECQPSYNIKRRTVELWEGQLCAGGVKGKDSCKGDSGGPLMLDNGRLHDIVGVVSFGPTPCGIENVPGVYTKVYHYIPWIRSNIKP